MATMNQIATDGISPKTCLRIWGELRSHQGVEPLAMGWPGATVEHRLRTLGHGAKAAGASPELTAPEEAVDQLAYVNAVAMWVDGIYRDMTPVQKLVARQFWINGKCWSDIAAQLSDDAEGSVTTSQVSEFAKVIRRKISRALEALQNRHFEAA